LSDARGEIAEIRRSIPEGSAILGYWILRDRTLGWLLMRDRFEPRTLSVTGSQLAGLVATLRERAQTSLDATERPPEARRLYETLIAPFERGLEGVTAIALVPHGDLSDLPFGLLQDPRSGQLLVERYTLSTLPFLARFPDPHGRSLATAESRPEALLVLGDTPGSDADRPALRDARREIESLAALFPRAVVVRGSEFTPQSVRGVPIVHFALHSEGHREATYLALAPQRALGAAALEQLPLSESAVVVLAACESGRGPTGPVGRTSTLPQAAFLTGAGAVVATLWPIRDADAARFSEAYYHSLLATGKPVLSLQKAQRSLIASGEPPSVWAAFVVFGFSPEVGLDVSTPKATPHRRKETV
jgi:CHAT domain-containing protein